MKIRVGGTKLGTAESPSRAAFRSFIADLRQEIASGSVSTETMTLLDDLASFCVETGRTGPGRSLVAVCEDLRRMGIAPLVRPQRELGCRCCACGRPMYRVWGGLVCTQGHGGADEPGEPAVSDEVELDAWWATQPRVERG